MVLESMKSARKGEGDYGGKDLWKEWTEIAGLVINGQSVWNAYIERCAGMSEDFGKFCICI